MLDAPFRLFEHIKNQLDANQLFVEIGSERGGGSTTYLNKLAQQTRNQFVTVDVDPVYVGEGVTPLRMPGEEFVSDVLPGMKKKVSLVLMDGFDWSMQPSAVRSGKAPADLTNKIEEYRHRGIEMNNVNSAVSHMHQMLGLRPYLAKRCAVMFCDTWFNWQLDTFEGKGAGAAYLLLADGFKILSASPKQNYLLMGKNISTVPTLPNLNLDALNRKYTGAEHSPNQIIYVNAE